MKDFPSMFGFSVSHTTRQPRHLERNGVHYHFTERSWMESAIQEGKFLESADVHGNLYGTSIAAVESVANDGKRCILDIDVQGARAVKKSALDAAFIFIAPPSLEQLEGRLRGRGTENEEQIQKRLKNAKAELECGRDSSIFNHYLINDDLDECYSELKRLLGLDLVDANEVQGANSNQAWLDSIHGHSAALVGGNVFVIGGDIDPNVEPALIIIDTNCIVGGAPGQTTRLRLVLHKHRSELPNGNHFVKTSKENGHL
ncbi:hypothetical protein KP509_09G087700 [Ceratopteris richardii]|nr:hypothetical protein KP509_09G087700 [Ceratopteris richardii]